MTPLMLDIKALEDERDRARLGLGPVLYFALLDELRGSRQIVNMVGIFLQIYTDDEAGAQIDWMMRPQSEGGDGPEYLEPRV